VSTAAVPGVDGLFIGPGDLSLRLGCPMDWSNPKMVAARHGKAWGRPSGSTEDIAHLAKKGARLIAHGSDFGAVMRMMPVFARTMKDGLGEA
jgi:4-hydroxy-2-oxoheptanedioate aldolase